jgi:O-antigen biosynthesis protein WbqP
MKRIFDFLFASILLIILMVPMVLIAIAIKFSSPGPIIFWSDRVGQCNKLFRMPKFRTMKVDTPNVATHLLENPNQYSTAIGTLLRKSSLDELPQLQSIIIGRMSFVGPRPALFNQSDLIEMRTSYYIHKLNPGLTGWAQINGRDELPIPEKVQFDHDYLKRQSFGFDMKILWLTFLKVIRKDGVTH